MAPHIIDMKIKDSTAYKEAFGADKEKMPDFIKDYETEMKKRCLVKMQKGSLARHMEAPFKGASVTHLTYTDPNGKVKKELYRPIDEMFVAGLPLKTNSITHTDFAQKDVKLCKYTLNKTKPYFD